MSTANEPLKGFRTCVQCHKPMPHNIKQPLWNYSIPICVDPACPNYGLLQVGEEELEVENCFKPKKHKRTKKKGPK